MEHTEYVQVVSEEWRTDGGLGWITPVVLVTGASPEFRTELLSIPERKGRHDPTTDIIRFEKFSHMDVRFLDLSQACQLEGYAVWGTLAVPLPSAL